MVVPEKGGVQVLGSESQTDSVILLRVTFELRKVTLLK